MADELPEKPVDPHPNKSLAYWNAADHARTNPIGVGLSIFSGVIIGGAVFLAAGFMGGLLYFENESSEAHRHEGLFAMLAFVGVTLCIAFLVYKFRNRKARPIGYQRGLGAVFFTGFLIGAGLACLLDGICFTGLARG